MATPQKPKRRLDADGFDVTCTIGRVIFGDGEVPPHVAAFTMIGEHGAPGTYRFPAEQGGDVTVTVDYTP